MSHNRVVSQEEWLNARKALLAREKEFTRFRDQLNAERMSLPWVKVEKDYVFDTPSGRKTLAELFDGRSQLLVYHFMLGSGWGAGCPSCSFVADHFEGARIHLNHHDVTLMAVSRASLAEIEAYRKRMGWTFPWASSASTDFNFDYHVSFTKDQLASGKLAYNFEELDAKGMPEELPGLSVFAKDDAGNVFHTYSTYARGLEEMLGAFMFLDRAPKGRNEKTIMDWVRRHDEYENTAKMHACCTADA
ncbi:DUF899 domain-containing protein [Microvirga terricola]|uniref:DUF899 family protein n=1 Tax=Microvirga terricola TaxID=2719797 RepID=A0ABX0V744_9HYPH|nr:thioredoxin family protein [Microvirga terricola]NIX75670.1 DUF899 family protein [Microvirga terricola]